MVINSCFSEFEDGRYRPFLSSSMSVKKGILFPEVKIIKQNNPINYEIREKEVRLISSTGEQMGIVSAKDAMKIAEDQNLDLVMISPTAKPPVCKIMDYHKFTDEQAKKEKEAKKNQKVVTLKEIRFSPKTEEHDITIKANKGREFLTDGDKVKVTVRFRGREAAYKENGVKILQTFATKLEDVGIIEKPSKMEGRNMIMILAPKK